MSKFLNIKLRFGKMCNFRRAAAALAFIVVLGIMYYFSAGDAIYQLIRNDDLTGLESYLDKHPDRIESSSRSGATPLMSAIMMGNKDVVEILIKRNANVNAKGMRNGFTPLHSAALIGSIDISRILLEHGASIKRQIRLRGNPVGYCGGKW